MSNDKFTKVMMPDCKQLADEFVMENHAVMMYEPLLPSGEKGRME